MTENDGEDNDESMTTHVVVVRYVIELFFFIHAGLLQTYLRPQPLSTTTLTTGQRGQRGPTTLQRRRPMRAAAAAGARDATRLELPVVCFFSCFFLLLTKASQANEDPRLPDTANIAPNEDQHRPTRANTRQRGPTTSTNDSKEARDASTDVSRAHTNYHYRFDASTTTTSTTFMSSFEKRLILINPGYSHFFHSFID
jgi:hypothetical protein